MALVCGMGVCEGTSLVMPREKTCLIIWTARLFVEWKLVWCVERKVSLSESRVVLIICIYVSVCQEKVLVKG